MYRSVNMCSDEPHVRNAKRPSCHDVLPIRRARVPSQCCTGMTPLSFSFAAFPLFQLVQVLQPRQHDLLARLLDLAGEEDLVEDGVDLVKVEDEIELADVAEEGVEDLDEEVDGLEVGELVVVDVDAGAEEEAGVAAVHDLVVAVLHEVGLVLLVARGHEAVHLALELDLLLVAVGGVPLGEAGFAPGEVSEDGGVREWGK